MSAQPLRDRRSERHAATRAEILDVAWEQVRAEGLAALSLRDLAQRVGMRAPSLYSYFSSKHAIFDAMFAQGAAEFRTHLAGLPFSGDPLTDLRTGLRGFIEFCVTDTARYQLLFQRTIPGFEPSADSFAIAVAGLDDMGRRMHDIGITDPQALDLATALGTGLADQQISNDPGGDRWLRLVDRAAEMFVAAHLPNAAKRKRARS